VPGDLMKRMIFELDTSSQVITHRRRGQKKMVAQAVVVVCAAWAVSLLPAQGNLENSAGTMAGGAQSAYVLGPEDQVVIRVLEADEISDKPVRVDASGYIPLLMIGRVRAAGLTVEELEKSIAKRLEAHLRTPQVSVSVMEFSSQPVSVIGSVNNPGVHQLQGRKTLVEILSLAGGLKPDAGPLVKITRPVQWGKIPLPQAVVDASGQYAVADVALKDLVEANSPQENILIRPHDVLSVPRARMVYVVGNVGKPGGFILDGQETITVLKALSLAQGLGKEAAPQKAKVIHPAIDGGKALESAVPLNKILQGTSPDLPLQAEDILFVPGSAPKKVAARAVEAAIQAGTGIAIFRR
jgi:polysaccharide biosynthesis/export protein